MHSDIKRLLVEVLLSDGRRAVAAASELSARAAWLKAILMVQSWRVTPQLLARVRSLNLQLPQTESGALRRVFLQAYGSTRVCVSRAIAATRCLERAGIPAACFKGIASMALLYGDPRERTIYDADLLVPRERFTDAIDRLDEDGFHRRGPETTVREYSAFVGDAPGFAGNKAISLYSDDGYELDLHWELSALGIETRTILERARNGSLLGQSIPVVETVHGFLLTVHHAIRENLAIDSVCRDLLDIRLWCERLHADGRLEESLECCAHAGCEVSALAATAVLAGFDPGSAAAIFASALRDRLNAADRRSGARLQELFHHQLAHGALDKDIFYLVHSRPWRQILHGLTHDWSGYRRSMETIEKQLGRQTSVKERAVSMARSIPGIRTLTLARELARIKYAVRRTR